MAGHSKWKNIQRTKSVNDLAKAKEFTRLSRMIEIAAQSGIDPTLNSELADAIEKAKKMNLPKDKITNAILKGAGKIKREGKLEKMLYEGYGPYNMMMLIQCITDNKNRTISELKTFFNKNGGKLLETGSIKWNFTLCGLVKLNSINEELFLLISGLEGVIDIDDKNYLIYTIPEKLGAIKDQITKYTSVENSELVWLPNKKNFFTHEQLNIINDFIDRLYKIDDVDKIWY